MDIIEQIISDPSGGTASLRGLELPSTGYFVGGLVSPLIVEDGSSVTSLRADLETFVSYLTDSTDAEYVGWWTDEETGRLWVDATSHHYSEYYAARYGRERREIAIFDIARERELRLAYVEGE